MLDNAVGNTDLAHEFLANASAEGKDRQAWDAIFRAYFGQARPVFGFDDLLGLSDELGLDREQTGEALTDRRYRPQVADDMRRAQRLGAGGAPFILVDGRYTVAGAQRTDLLVDALRQAWDASHPVAMVPDGAVCGPEDCVVPTRG